MLNYWDHHHPIHSIAFEIQENLFLAMSIPSNLNKEFIEFVKAIGDSKTKQEEDVIVVKEMSVLKRKIMDTKCDNVFYGALILICSVLLRRTCSV